MTKCLSIFMIILFFSVIGCHKSKTNDPGPDYDYLTSYLPLARGNTWTYIHNDQDTVVTTVNGNNFMQGLQTFYEVEGDGTGGAYYSQADNMYYMMTDVSSGPAFSSPILDTSQPDGYSTTTKDSIAYSNDATPILSMMTIVESNFIMNVNGQTYKNVTHTVVDVYQAFNGSYMNIQSYDFYFSLGIGLIEIDKSNEGVVYDSMTIVNYKVK